MPTQPFDYGLFGDGNSTPNSDYSQNYQAVQPGLGGAASALQYNSTGAVRGDAFGQLTNMVTQSRRMNAVKAARAAGITPDMGDQYYSFIRDKLLDDGDAAGADMMETKRTQVQQLKIDNEYKIAQTQGVGLDNRSKLQEITSNAPERKLKVLEKGAINDEERTAVMNRQADLEEKAQNFREKTFETPEDKWKYTEKQLNLAGAIEDRSTDRKYKYEFDLALAKAGIPKATTAGDATLGTKMWLANMQKYMGIDNDPNTTSLIKQWETHSGMSPDEIFKGLSSKKKSDPAYIKSKAAVDKIGIEVGTSFKQLKADYPGTDDLKLWDLAIEAPVGARLMKGSDGTPIWRTTDGKYYKTKVE